MRFNNALPFRCLIEVGILLDKLSERTVRRDGEL